MTNCPEYHGRHEGGHCWVMPCPNYVSKCPLHAIARTGDVCNRDNPKSLNYRDPDPREARSPQGRTVSKPESSN